MSFIDPDLFKDLQLLLKIYLKIRNLRTFLHSRGAECTRSLNYYLPEVRHGQFNWSYIKKHALMLEIEVIDDARFPVEFFPFLKYQFEQEDLCIFVNFPHKKLVMPVITGNLSHASCLTTWLYKHFHIYYRLMGEKQFKWSLKNKQVHLNVTKNITERLAACNMSSRIEQCQAIKSVTDQHRDAYFDLANINESITLANSILLDHSGHLVSLFGALTNFATSVTILFSRRKSNNKKSSIRLDGRFYDFMLMNSVLNSLYCLLYFFKFTIECTPIPFNNFLVLNNCYVRDVSIHTIGGFLKLVTNFVYIQMCLNRYMLVGKEHCKLVKRIQKIKVKNFLSAIGIVSSLLSLVAYLQRLFFNNSYGGINMKYKDSFTKFYYWNYYHQFDAKLSIEQKHSQLPILIAFTVIHYLFSYLIFCTLSTLIDAMKIVKLN